MHTSVAISVLLGAGALAHPHFKLNNPLAHVHHKRQQPVEVVTTTIGNQVVVEDIFVQTITQGGNPPQAAAPTSSSSVAAPERIVVAAPKKQQVDPVQQNDYLNYHPNPIPVSTTPIAQPAPTSTPPPPAPSTTAPAPAQSSQPSQPSGGNDGAPTSNGKSILASANKYRSLMGYPEFTYSSKLGANAADTNQADGANSMTHKLNSGSMAQCIAQGDDTLGSGDYSPFDLTYLGWLCEISDGRLGNDCNVMESTTHMIISDDGHAKILRDPSYTQMGCNYLESTQHLSYKGLWTCDFA